MSTKKRPTPTHRPIVTLSGDIPDLETVKATLLEHGYVPIVCKPEQLSVAVPVSLITPDDTLMSALHALDAASLDSVRSGFTKELFRRMKSRESKR